VLLDGAKAMGFFLLRKLLLVPSYSVRSMITLEKAATI